jgi:hypothetical protein
MSGTLQKPIIAAINGFAMGGGFQLVERTDLRVAVPAAVFEISEAKRWLLGGYDHGFVASMPHPIATEMALDFGSPPSACTSWASSIGWRSRTRSSRRHSRWRNTCSRCRRRRG